MIRKNLTPNTRALIEMLAELSPREWDILNLRYNKGVSMYKVAKQYKVSAQRIASIENRAIRNIMIAFGEVELPKKEEKIKEVLINKPQVNVVIDI